jgi:hypothetical protein
MWGSRVPRQANNEEERKIFNIERGRVRTASGRLGGICRQDAGSTLVQGCCGKSMGSRRGHQRRIRVKRMSGRPVFFNLFSGRIYLGLL